MLWVLTECPSNILVLLLVKSRISTPTVGLNCSGILGSLKHTFYGKRRSHQFEPNSLCNLEPTRPPHTIACARRGLYQHIDPFKKVSQCIRLHVFDR